MASQEEEKVQDITYFLLLAGRCRGIPGSTEGSRHHILSIACRKMPWHPRKYGRFETSHPFFCLQEDAAASQEEEKVQDITSFFCVQEDAVASHEVEKVQDITYFLLRAGRCRGLPGSSEGLKHHILSFACKKMPWPPRKKGRFMISHPFFCLREDAMASKEVQKVHDILSSFDFK
jgi:hypothetical protein